MSRSSTESTSFEDDIRGVERGREFFSAMPSFFHVRRFVWSPFFGCSPPPLVMDLPLIYWFTLVSIKVVNSVLDGPNHITRTNLMNIHLQ